MATVQNDFVTWTGDAVYKMSLQVFVFRNKISSDIHKENRRKTIHS